MSAIKLPDFQAMAAKKYPTADRIEMKKYSALVKADKLAISPLEGKFCNKAKISALNVAKFAGKIFAGLVTPFFAVWVAFSNLFAKIQNKHIDAGNKIMLTNQEVFVKAKTSEFIAEVAKDKEAADAKEAAKPLNRVISFTKEHKGLTGAVAAAAVAIATEVAAYFVGGSFNPLCAIKAC
jgi:hypothetical protein